MDNISTSYGIHVQTENQRLLDFVKMMYAKIEEFGFTKEVFSNPKSKYTKTLIRAIPTVTDEEEMIPGTYDHVIYEIQGDLSDLAQVKDNERKEIEKTTNKSSKIFSKLISLFCCPTTIYY